LSIEKKSEGEKYNPSILNNLKINTLSQKNKEEMDAGIQFLSNKDWTNGKGSASFVS